MLCSDHGAVGPTAHGSQKLQLTHVREIVLSGFTVHVSFVAGICLPHGLLHDKQRKLNDSIHYSLVSSQDMQLHRGCAHTAVIVFIIITL